MDFVVEGFAAERRVDHGNNFAGLDEVHDVRAAFVHFVNGFDFDARAGESGGGAAGGDDFNSGGEKVRDEADVALIVIVDAGAVRWRLSAGRQRAGGFANARPKVDEMPITSPVERISRPRIMSTPRSVNGNTRRST